MDINTKLDRLQQLEVSTIISTLTAGCLPYLNGETMLDKLSNNDQDVVSFCCSMLETQLRVEQAIPISSSHSTVSKNDGTRLHGNDNSGVDDISSKSNESIVSNDYILLLEILRQQGFDAVHIFLHFVIRTLCLDGSLLIDLLSSNETNTLEYMLRITKRLISQSLVDWKSAFDRITRYDATQPQQQSCGDTFTDLKPNTAVIWLVSSERVDDISTKDGDATDLPCGMLTTDPNPIQVSHYEWNREYHPTASSSSTTAIDVGSEHHSLDDVCNFFRDVQQRLRESFRHKLLPFNPKLLIHRLQLILQTMQ